MSAMKMDFICKEVPAAQPAAPAEHADGVSDHEDSEDEQLEHAAWQDVDLNPAVELVAKLVRESLDAGKTYNKSITAKTSQLLTGCDALLLDIKGLAEARADARQRAGQRPGGGQGGAGCSCGQAMAMLPLRNPEQSRAAAAGDAANKLAAPSGVDEATEDQTDRALAKMEAAMVRLREMAELIQATSMQGEANLVSKVSLQTGTFQALRRPCRPVPQRPRPRPSPRSAAARPPPSADSTCPCRCRSYRNGTTRTRAHCWTSSRSCARF